jgi:uncharacterized membrane protein YccC
MDFIWEWAKSVTLAAIIGGALGALFGVLAELVFGPKVSDKTKGYIIFACVLVAFAAIKVYFSVK